MRGRLVFQCVLILWLAQSAHTGSYGAGVSGVPTSREAHFNGKRAHNGGGAGRRLIPLKGVGSPMGAQNGYGGYPNKGVGNGLAAGMANGAGKKGYSAANGAARAQGGWPQGYDGHAAPTNQHPMRGNGYSYHAGVFGAQGNKGNGYGGPPAGPQSGNKGYGGALGGKGAKPNGLAGAGRKPMKGYGQPYYGAGVGVSQIQGVPQLARNQGKAYGYNGYGTQPTGGSTGGYGMGLGPRYGSGGMKGPKPGYGGAAGVPNRQGAVPNGHGGTKCPVKPGYGIGAVPNGYGAKPNGYGAGGTKGYGPGTGNGAALGGFGNKLSGYGWLGAHSPPQTTKGVGPMLPGQGFGGFAGIPNQPAQAPNSRFVQRPYGNGPKIPGAPNGKGLKGGVLSPQQPGSAPWEGASPQRPIIEGDSLPAPEPTSGRLVLVTQDQYQKLPSPVPQGKLYMQPMPQATPVYAPVFPQGKQPKLGHKDSSGSAPMRPLDKSLKAPSYEVGPAGETPAALPQESVGGASVSKGQGPKAAKPVKNKCTFIVHCGPGGTNGQWMKIPGAGYNAGLGASAGSNTKGYGAGVPNRFGAKPGYGTGGYTVPINGYGAGLGYPNAGEPQQPIYSQGANLAAAGYVKGNSYPDLGHGVPTMNAKSGGGLQAPYNGAPAVPAALDGVGQPEQQPAGLGPNGKKGPVYGGMEGLLYGGPTGMGPEKSNAKYGIGGLQFGGSPQTGTNGGGYGVYEPTADLKSGKYGGANTGGGVPGQYGYGGLPNIGHLLSRGSNGHMAGKYGYGGMPHEVQPVGFVPQLQYPGAGQNGPGASPYQSGPLGFGPNVNYGGGDASYGPQGLVGEGKSAGKNVDNQGLHQSQPLESASERRSVGGDPTLSRAVDGEGMANNKYENVGYISGRKLQPEVISLPAAPTPVPMGSDDLPSDLRGAGGLSFDSADADQQSAARGSAQPDDPEQMPRQLHIQQRLKLHLHPQGSKNGKYDLNGFFGNTGYQG